MTAKTTIIIKIKYKDPLTMYDTLKEAHENLQREHKSLLKYPVSGY